MVVVVAGSVAALVNDRQDRLEDALLNVMGKQKTKWEVVDMEKELHNLWLDGFFLGGLPFPLHAVIAGVCGLYCQAGWPSMNAVHDLATRMKKSRKESGDESWVPWVPFELRRFLPDCFAEHVITNFEVEEDKQPKVSSRRLELAAWLAAWDG